MRADAVRNRAAILEAAEALLGSEGPTVTTEAVAKRAGVGIGTVFRHFPTKQDLLMAVISARLDRLTDRARATDPDDESALFGFFEQVVEHTTTSPTIAHALAAVGVDADAALKQPKAEFMTVLQELVGRAQESGTLRDDVGVGDVFDLLVAVVHVANTRGREGDRVHRALDVILDGLRA